MAICTNSCDGYRAYYSEDGQRRYESSYNFLIDESYSATCVEAHPDRFPAERQVDYGGHVMLAPKAKPMFLLPWCRGLDDLGCRDLRSFQHCDLSYSCSELYTSLGDVTTIRA